jgi:hypothetical protein
MDGKIPILPGAAAARRGASTFAFAVLHGEQFPEVDHEVFRK